MEYGVEGGGSKHSQDRNGPNASTPSCPLEERSSLQSVPPNTSLYPSPNESSTCTERFSFVYAPVSPSFASPAEQPSVGCPLRQTSQQQYTTSTGGLGHLLLAKRRKTRRACPPGSANPANPSEQASQPSSCFAVKQTSNSQRRLSVGDDKQSEVGHAVAHQDTTAPTENLESPTGGVVRGGSHDGTTTLSAPQSIASSHDSVQPNRVVSLKAHPPSGESVSKSQPPSAVGGHVDACVELSDSGKIPSKAAAYLNDSTILPSQQPSLKHKNLALVEAKLSNVFSIGYDSGNAEAPPIDRNEEARTVGKNGEAQTVSYSWQIGQTLLDVFGNICKEEDELVKSIKASFCNDGEAGVPDVSIIETRSACYTKMCYT